MPRSTTTRWISSSIETVFLSLRDIRSFLPSVPYLRIVDWPTNEAFAAGAVGILRAGRRELKVQVITYTTNRLLELEVTEGGFVTRERLELVAEMGGTHITHTSETLTTALPLGRTRLSPMQRAIAHIIGEIKAGLEGMVGGRVPDLPFYPRDMRSVI